MRLRLKLYIDIFLQGKGLNYVNDEMIMHWEKCNELYTYNWMILKEEILPVETKTFANDIDILDKVIYMLEEQNAQRGY